MAKSMTIEEMRFLHQRALNDAEAKRTELKLVLASRYRELVGSSDEVIKMKDRAQELHGLVQALPSLLEKLVNLDPVKEEGKEDEINNILDSANLTVFRFRQKLSELPLTIHRSIDKDDVHHAALKLIELFTLIASQTNAYPLANILSKTSPKPHKIFDDPDLVVHMKMTFLMVQTLRDKISRVASRFLARAASYGKTFESPIYGAQHSASVLASMNLLDTRMRDDRAAFLLDVYFESKAKLLLSLLGKLIRSHCDESNSTVGASIAEKVLSKIVLILQYDVVMHPYQIFILRNFPVKNQGVAAIIMKSLPLFDPEAVKAKCSKFLSTHLQLVRSKAKSVLVSIAGTTASALGKIRQSLYDKTDGIEAINMLNSNGLCTWDDAVGTIVDIHAALSNSSDSVQDNTTNKFSFWSALFSITFTSLVHSLLTTAFQSVHTSVISSLRASLLNAPPLASILPHEAYRNTLSIACNLDKALLKVSDDAHELLIHAEERVESERRLRESLYVETCKIMGRLICELRRLAFSETNNQSEGTKELIIGRLCYLLKFRLTALSKLLSPESLPASMRSTIGMIDFNHLKSSFELADDDDDGLITFGEAIEAVESAFAGTPFHGSDMVIETLLLSTDGKELKGGSTQSHGEIPCNVTLSELSLLTAKGLRHEKCGSESALGILQQSLDGIISGSLERWASAAVSIASDSLHVSFQDFFLATTGVQDDEWRRLFSRTDDVICVSPFVACYFLECASMVNRSICPSDALPPLPMTDHALSHGINLINDGSVATLADIMRLRILNHSVTQILSLFDEEINKVLISNSNIQDTCPSAVIQILADLSFIKRCVEKVTNANQFSEKLERSIERITVLLSQKEKSSQSPLMNKINERNQVVLDSSNLFFSSLFGCEMTASPTSSDEIAVTGTSAVFHAPISSSKRFVLLPVQADRSVNDIQLRGTYSKEKNQLVDKLESNTANVMSSGFGFFSSMLKKK